MKAYTFVKNIKFICLCAVLSLFGSACEMVVVGGGNFSYNFTSNESDSLTVAQDQCTLATADVVTQSGAAAVATKATLIGIYPTSGLTFYSDATCTTEIEYLSLAKGDSSSDFYFKASMTGQHEIKSFPSSKTVNKLNVTVSSGTFAGFRVDPIYPGIGQTSPNSGEGMGLKVTPVDSNGNSVTTGFAGTTITFTSTDGLATLPADYTFTAYELYHYFPVSA